MALIIRAPVILTYALLAKDPGDEGIAYQDVREYCDRLKAAYFGRY